MVEALESRKRYREQILQSHPPLGDGWLEKTYPSGRKCTNAANYIFCIYLFRLFMSSSNNMSCSVFGHLPIFTTSHVSLTAIWNLKGITRYLSNIIILNTSLHLSSWYLINKQVHRHMQVCLSHSQGLGPFNPQEIKFREVNELMSSDSCFNILLKICRQDICKLLFSLNHIWN